MLFGGRATSPINTNKNRIGNPHRQPSRSPIRRQTGFTRHDQKNLTTNNHKSLSKQPQHNAKSKQNMAILYLLEDIHCQLNFNQYDAFAEQKIIEAKNNLQYLINFYKDDPICPKHRDLLNLFCQNDKQVICVSCMFKGNQEHKNHKVKALQSVQKPIQYETIRLQEKTKSLISQLTQIQDQITIIQKQICQNYMNISNNSVGIINQTIRQLEKLKQEYDKKLSVSYRRTTTIIKRYGESLGMMIDIMDSNLHKSSLMQGLGKYLLLKQLNQESTLIEELSNKYFDNKVALDQWKKAVKETEKLMIKKKIDINKTQKDDIYVVTKF